MQKPIYDYKGRVVGYESISYPSGNTNVVRPQRLTKQAEAEDAKEVYDRMWRNKTRR